MRDGEIVNSMRVVVGQPKNPTPMMAAYIRFTSLNPYWNVPPDLAAERIAPNVVKEGLAYLDRHGYQVFPDWIDEATDRRPGDDRLAGGGRRHQPDPGPPAARAQATRWAR